VRSRQRDLIGSGHLAYNPTASRRGPAASHPGGRPTVPGPQLAAPGPGRGRGRCGRGGAAGLPVPAPVAPDEGVGRAGQPARHRAADDAACHPGRTTAPGGAGAARGPHPDYAESEAAAAARPALATCLESLGKYRDAARAFEKLADQGEPFYLLAAGRCRELAGELGAARQLYERLAGDETLDEGLIRVAQARLSDLARGKRLPPPPPLAPRQGAGAPLPSVVLPAPADTTLGPVAAPQPAGPEREMD